MQYLGSEEDEGEGTWGGKSAKILRIVVPEYLHFFIKFLCLRAVASSYKVK